MRPVLGISRTQKISDDSIPHHHHYLDFQVDLSQEEYGRYLQARDALQDFVSDAQLFMVSIWNYQEYYDILNAYLDAYIRKDWDYFDKRPMYLNINRAALNLLSSVRTYLDHTETSLKRRHGETAQIFLSFDRACSHAYDTYFSYRFLYKLRDYAQHCGFPINNITLGARSIENDPNKPQYSLLVGTVRDVLLANFNWKKLTEELSRQPDTIDINKHIDTMMKCLEEINSGVTKDEFSTLRGSAAYIKSLLQRISYTGETDGEPIVFELEVTEDDTGKVTSLSHFQGHRVPVEIVDAVARGSLEGITRQVVVETM